MSLFGPNSGSSFVDDASVGTIAWTSPANVGARDNTNAAAALTLGTTSHYLLATGFGFAVPAQLTVLGVIVEILRNGTLNQNVTDASVRLVRAGVVVGDERANVTAAYQWPDLSQRYRRYGAAVDLWGVPWLTPADVNDIGFGIAVSATDVFDEGFGANALIDHVQITLVCTDS